jgi:DNA-binding response OmpR family regulator
VDDEFAIAQTLTWVLEEAGYSATFALSGKAALDLSNDHAVDLAVVDVTLPDLDGIKTAVEICKRIPNCKILLMSGDTESAPLLEAARRDGIKFEVLAKPIPPSELLPKLASLLAERKASAGED